MRFWDLGAVFAIGLISHMPLNESRADSVHPAAVQRDLEAAIKAYDGGDLAHAREAWHRAAAAGSTDAMTSLANMYDRGEGVRPDVARARRWYRRAAERGDIVGQLNLGEMYLQGRGLPRDRMQAAFWLSLAGAGGNAWALSQAAKVRAGLNDHQRELLREMISTWRPKRRGEP